MFVPFEMALKAGGGKVLFNSAKVRQFFNSADHPHFQIYCNEKESASSFLTDDIYFASSPKANNFDLL